MAPDTSHAFPKKVLLATDLSARCDRALDRSALLAEEWKADLTIFHVLEKAVQLTRPASRYEPSWRREPDRRYAFAKRQIEDDMLEHKLSFKLVIEEGDPSEIILRAAGERDSDFIITGVARGETLGRLILGGTVDRVVRNAVVPVLVVKKRARRSYRNVMVAVDFSKASRHALVTTLDLFPDANIILLHCYDSMPSGFVDLDTADHVGLEMADGYYRDFLNEFGARRDIVARLPLLMERGGIDNIVQSYAADKPLDLLVIGSQGRNAVARFILGSTAELLLSSATCDVLVVNGDLKNRLP